MKEKIEMQNKIEALSQRVEELQKGYSKLGAARVQLLLNPEIAQEEKIFMLMIQAQNAIAEREDEIKRQIEILKEWIELNNQPQ